jgi:molybdopterin converting factor small subunit
MKLKLSCGSKILFSEFKHEAPVNLESVLQSVKESHPKIYAGWCDSEGRLRSSLLAFVNDEHIRYKDGIQTILRDGDKVHIVPPITGG